MADTLARLELPEFNGSAVAMGFCYGGPYTLPAFPATSTQMLDYLREVEDVSAPVCMLWGDRDHRAPKEVFLALARALQFSRRLGCVACTRCPDSHPKQGRLGSSSM
jgi:dienelactone hydrolase